LISLAICLCVVLALSTTLRASSTVLTLGNYDSGSPQYGGSYVGPYPGAIETNSDPNTQLLVSLFCLDGNLTDYFTYQYDGTVESLSSLSADPNFESDEQAAFLASLVMYEANQDKITISVSGVGSGGYLTQTANGTMSITDFVNNVEGPVSEAIWEIMGTQDSTQLAAATNNSAVEAYLLEANNAYSEFLQYPANPLVQAFNSSVMIFIPNATIPPTQRFFTAYGDVSDMLAPEPGTMVLFGTGFLLTALGCARRLRRPR
jgi:hypothetical protein